GRSVVHAERNGSERMRAGLLPELAGSPDAHECEADAAIADHPLAAEAYRRLPDPGFAADTMAVADQVAVERKIPSHCFCLKDDESMNSRLRRDRGQGIRRSHRCGRRWRAVFR